MRQLSFHFKKVLYPPASSSPNPWFATGVESLKGTQGSYVTQEMHFFNKAKLGESIVCRYPRLLLRVKSKVYVVAREKRSQTTKLTSKTIRTYRTKGEGE